MNGSIYELLLAYARLGLRDWSTKSLQVKMRARAIGVGIAEHEARAARVLAKPFKPSATSGHELMLIPMPCKQRKVFAAFFTPWIGPQGWQHLSFDLVVLLPQGSPIAFRFEPGAAQSATAHGYDHVQLNETLGQEQVALVRAVSPLPTTYPAFPIPSQDTMTRFLAMVVAMHGFPSGVDDVFDDAFKGQPNKRKSYLEMTQKMLTH